MNKNLESFVALSVSHFWSSNLKQSWHEIIFKALKGLWIPMMSSNIGKFSRVYWNGITRNTIYFDSKMKNYYNFFHTVLCFS